MPVIHQFPKTGRALFEVEIGDDGGIIVNEGDILGGYSMAIHGTPTVLKEYGRPNMGGTPIPVTDPDKIYAHEFLYHLPSTEKPDPSYTPIIREPSLKEVEKIVKKALENADLPGGVGVGNVVGWIVTGVNGGLSVSVSVATAIGVVVSPGVLAVGAILSALGPLIGGLVGVASASNAGFNNTTTLAYAHGYVAWVYEAKPRIPTFPMKLENELKRSRTQSPVQIQRHKDAWSKGIKKGQMEAEQHAREFAVQARAALKKRNLDLPLDDPLLVFRGAIRAHYKTPRDYYGKMLTELTGTLGKRFMAGGVHMKIVEQVLKDYPYA